MKAWPEASLEFLGDLAHYQRTAVCARPLKNNKVEDFHQSVYQVNKLVSALSVDIVKILASTMWTLPVKVYSESAALYPPVRKLKKNNCFSCVYGVSFFSLSDFSPLEKRNL